MPGTDLSLLLGWTLMALGAVSGAVIGLRFHDENWAGGYGSFRRRLLRLGHISFFGLGIVNVLFGMTAARLIVPPAYATAAVAGLAVAGVTMPLVCFLSAWRRSFRQFFPLPVLGVLVGIGALLLGSAAS